MYENATCNIEEYHGEFGRNLMPIEIEIAHISHFVWWILPLQKTATWFYVFTIIMFLSAMTNINFIQ